MGSRYSAHLRSLSFVLSVFSAVFVLGAYATAGSGSGGAGKGFLSRAAKAAMPDGFIENKGQWDSRALFHGNAPGTDIWVTRTGVVYDFHTETPAHLGKRSHLDLSQAPLRSGHVVEMKFLNSPGASDAVGVMNNHKPVNFLGVGVQAHAESFQEAKVLGIYNGVDMRVYKDANSPRFDLMLSPGADPSKIKFTYAGADSVRQREDGSVLVGTRFGEAVVSDLVAYQQQAGTKTPVRCSFKVNGDGTVGFKVGEYDRTRTLIIDPIVWSTLMGGAGATDIGLGVTVDKYSQPYITGWTDAPNFPTNLGAYNRIAGNQSAFITKFNADASNYVFSTLINTSGAAIGVDIAVDSVGRPVIAGVTNGGIPITFGTAAQATFGGGRQDIFLVRLSADGSALSYGSYFGGSADEYLGGMKLDKSDNIYIGSTTNSLNMRVSSTAFQKVNRGGYDGYVASFSSAGAFRWGTYIGGVNDDSLAGIDIDTTFGDVYAAGSTKCLSTQRNAGFPTTTGVLDASPHLHDGYIAKIRNGGASLAFSTLLGGSDDDFIEGIAVDGNGNSYVIGVTFSVDFPTTPGAFGTVFGAAEDFVAKVALDGASIIYSTYMNGGGAQQSIAVDDLGFAYICGYINSSQGNTIATMNPDQAAYAGPSTPSPDPNFDPGDMYLQVLNDSGTGLVYGSYYGGDHNEEPFQVFVDPSRSAYCVGWTDSFTGQGSSRPFPTTSGVFKQFLPVEVISPPSASPDAFLTKFDVRSEPLLTGLSLAQTLVAGTQSTTATINLAAAATGGGASVHLSSSNENLAVVTDTSGNPLPSNTLIIPAGSSSGSFGIQTSDVVQTFTVQITSELEGIRKIASLTIAPWLQSLSLAPFTVTGGNLASGRIYLSVPATGSGLVVNLTSSDTTKAFPYNIATGQVVNNVTVPAGQNTVVFDIRTKGVDYPANVTILARVVTPALAQVHSAVLQIVPAHLKSVVFSPPVVDGGEPSTGALLLDGEAGPTPVRAALSLGVGTAPITLSAPTVTVQPGHKSVDFPVQTGVTQTNSYRVIIATRYGNGEQKSGTLFVDQIAIQSVDLDSSTVLGGTVLSGHVTVSTPASPSGLNLTIATDNPTYGALNLTKLYVPPGAIRSQDFTVTTPITNVIPDPIVHITASKAGYVSQRATLTVRHLGVTFSGTPITLIGGIQSFTGKVTLSEPAPSSGITFSLTSDNKTVLPVPFSVTVPGGATSATFTTRTTTVSASQTVHVTLSINAKPAAITRILTLTVNPLSLTVTLDRTFVTGGLTNANGTVTLSTAAVGSGVVVGLKSNNYAAVPSPSAVTVAAGSRTAAFKVISRAVSSDQLATITASITGGAFNTATLTVLAPRVQTITVDLPVVIGGFPTSGTVTTDVGSPAGGILVSLSSNNSAVQLPSTVTVAAGYTYAHFNITTTAVSSDTTVTLTATFPSSHSVTTTMVVQSPRSGSLVFSPNDVVGGTSTTGIASIDSPAPAGGQTIYLAKDPSASGSPYVTIPAKVVIPAGAKSVKFTVTTTAVSRTVATTVTATIGTNGEQVTATLTLEP